IRSQGRLKLQNFIDDEAIVLGFEEKRVNTNKQDVDERGYSKRSSKKEGLIPSDTLGALVVSWNGLEFKIGTGFTEEQRKDIWGNREQYLNKVITFKYQELTKSWVPRFPVWKCFREEYN